MTATRTIAIAAAAAIAGLFANAIRLAAADPVQDVVRPASPDPAQAAATKVETASRPGRRAPAGTWRAPSRPRVSAGVLARAASRKPLERDPACPPARTQDAPAAAEACAARESCDVERIEIEWHADPASP